MQLELKPALCLDLDGTVRRSKSGATFIKNFDDVELIQEVVETAWHYKDAGFLVFGITNQAGIAHGFKNKGDVVRENNVTINLSDHLFYEVFYAPCDEKGNTYPFDVRTFNRKPNIGMLAVCENFALVRGLGVIDWNNSLIVGDRPEDEQLAKNAEVSFMHVNTFLDKGLDVLQNPIILAMDNYIENGQIKRGVPTPDAQYVKYNFEN